MCNFNNNIMLLLLNLVLLSQLWSPVESRVKLLSNYETKKVNEQSRAGDSITMPIIINSNQNLQNSLPAFRDQHIQKYQLYDSEYRADTRKLSLLE